MMKYQGELSTFGLLDGKKESSILSIGQDTTATPKMSKVKIKKNGSIKTSLTE